jgi:hypothetical protein
VTERIGDSERVMQGIGDEETEMKLLSTWRLVVVRLGLMGGSYAGASRADIVVFASPVRTIIRRIEKGSEEDMAALLAQARTERRRMFS